VLKRAGYDNINTYTIKHLTKFCKQCQLHAKSLGRFKFTIKDNCNFNYLVIVNILYLNRRLIIQAINKAIAFNAARFLKDISAKIA
jgi:hypothetical protein